MKVKFIILFSLCIGILFSPAFSEQVYFWRGAGGQVNFSDRPVTGAKKVTVNPGYSYYHVQTVYDGDTVKLQNGTVIRLIGVNSPEIESRYKKGEPGGEIAKRWLSEYLKGKTVRVQTDLEKKDKYGRTLAYLFTPDHVHINELLLKSGMAVLTIHPPNLQFLKPLFSAQQQAIHDEVGIWRLPYYQAKPVDQLTLENYKGWKRLVGTVKSIDYSRKYAYLKMSDMLALKIKLSNRNFFPDLENYLNQSLMVSGWPKRSKRQLNLPIYHGSAITVLN